VLLGIVAHRSIGARRTQRGIVVAASAAGAVVALLLGLLLAAGGLPLPVLLAFLFAFGTSVGVSLPAQSTILVDLFGARRGTAVGLYTTLRFGGAALGPLLAAWIEPLFGRSAVLLALAIALGVAAWRVRQGLSEAAEATAHA
jgi:MFS family permease